MHHLARGWPSPAASNTTLPGINMKKRTSSSAATSLSRRAVIAGDGCEPLPSGLAESLVPGEWCAVGVGGDDLPDGVDLVLGDDVVQVLDEDHAAAAADADPQVGSTGGGAGAAAPVGELDGDGLGGPERGPVCA